MGEAIYTASESDNSSSKVLQLFLMLNSEQKRLSWFLSGLKAAMISPYWTCDISAANRLAIFPVPMMPIFNMVLSDLNDESEDIGSCNISSIFDWVVLEMQNFPENHLDTSDSFFPSIWAKSLCDNPFLLRNALRFCRIS